MHWKTPQILNSFSFRLKYFIAVGNGAKTSDAIFIFQESNYTNPTVQWTSLNRVFVHARIRWIPIVVSELEDYLGKPPTQILQDSSLASMWPKAEWRYVLAAKADVMEKLSFFLTVCNTEIWRLKGISIISAIATSKSTRRRAMTLSMWQEVRD